MRGHSHARPSYWHAGHWVAGCRAPGPTPPESASGSPPPPTSDLALDSLPPYDDSYYDHLTDYLDSPYYEVYGDYDDGFDAYDQEYGFDPNGGC